jgi:hypothetical protein
MAIQYEYKLILAVNEKDLNSLDNAGFNPDTSPMRITTNILKPNSALPILTHPTFFQVSGDSTIKKESALQFVTLSFERGITGDEIDAQLKSGAFKDITDNCQHYSIYAIATDLK